MKRKFLMIFLVLISLTVWGQKKIENKLTDEHQNIKGTKVSIIPSKGFTDGLNFLGLQQTESDSSIMILDITGLYSEISKGITKENMLSKALEMKKIETLMINGYPAIFATAETKGDWKPLVFIITDGIPTDHWQSGLYEFKKRKVAFTVACAAGSAADTNVLKQITESGVSLDTADSQSIAKFFTWVIASIGVSLTKVKDSGKEVTGLNELPPPPSELNIVV